MASSIRTVGVDGVVGLLETISYLSSADSIVLIGQLQSSESWSNFFSRGVLEKVDQGATSHVCANL